VDKNDEKYCQAMFETFRTNGWEIFIQNITADAVRINSVDDTEDNDDLWFRKGQLDVIASVKRLESEAEDLADIKNETDL